MSLAQSAWLIGGPPGVIPAASAGVRYFLTVLRSTPSDVASSLVESQIVLSSYGLRTSTRLA
ncbi:hypothetical protein GCM10020000_84680 [Streptomyces olivoverticillatus]